MSGRETAEVVAARALLADYETQMHEFVTGTRTDTDWLTWSLRLAQHTRQLLDATATGATAGHPATGVAPDGSGWLSPAAVTTVIGALADACAYRTERGWTDTIGACRLVARQLGDDR